MTKKILMPMIFGITLMVSQETISSDKIDNKSKINVISNVRNNKNNYNIRKVSWYGPKFHGRKMANGKKFNMHNFTAAHKTLPLNKTRVKFINPKNNKSVVVRITDRGPYYGDRAYDLSYAAAKQLGIIEKGVANLQVVVLSN